jgi:hypothetical protein
MFYFVVRHLRWLARVPGMPHLFDAILLAWTCLCRRSRLVAMEALEAQALHLPGIRLRVHRFGGIGFARDNRELGHIHGNGLLDAWVGRGRREALIAAGRVRRHHVLPRSGWISFQLESVDDVPFALDLLSGRASDGPKAI